MTKQAKVLAIELSSIPETHVVRREQIPSSCLITSKCVS